MATSKKAASRKATGKGSEKGKKGKTGRAAEAEDVTSKWLLRRDGEADHSPIIITDGSASIEFSLLGPYRHEGGGHHTSRGIRLREVYANRNHLTPSSALEASDPPGGPICHSFTGTSRYRILVTVRLGNDDETFEIIGRASGLFRSPSVDFDIIRFVEDNANFPPDFPRSARRFGNLNGNITRLQIFRGGDLIHDCPLASGNGIKYTITDPH